jgi:hypothetical protein
MFRVDMLHGLVELLADEAVVDIVVETHHVELLGESVAVINHPLRELLLDARRNGRRHDEVTNEGAETLVESVLSDDTHFVGLGTHHHIPVGP